jgi:ATP-dependent helicase IRC3
MQRISLRPYQVAAVDAITAAATRGIRRPLIQLPTGTGKTIIFAEQIRRQGGRALVLAHRDELIQQAVEKLQMVDPSVQLGVVKAERDEHDAPVTVASVQTLSRGNRLARVMPNYQTIVVDEAHHAPADTYMTVLQRMRAFADDGPLVLGVTATAERYDDVALGAVFQEIVYTAELLDMISAGYLCDLRAIRVHVAANLDKVHVRGGDLVASELDTELLAANTPQHVAEAYRTYAPDRKALLFTATIRLAHEMAAALQATGVRAEAMDGSTPLAERRAILRRLRSGETEVVANCAVLTEGFDEPTVDCIILARPTKSRPLYIQMVGRGTRPHPGKRDCLVLDVVANTRHALQSIGTLLGDGEIELRHGESLTEAAERLNPPEADPPPEGRLVAAPVTLFDQRSFRWIAATVTRYVLSVPSGLIVLDSDADLRRWAVTYVCRTRERRVLGADLDLGYAQGVAEDFARHCGAGALVRRDAPWRSGPATDKQLAALMKWRVPVHAGLTKGEASDLLAAAVGRRV